MSSKDDQPACPVDHKAREAWLQAAQAQASAASQQQAQSSRKPDSPLSGTCDSNTIDQSPSQTQSLFKPKFASSRLSTQRETSSIPRATAPDATTSPNAQTSAPPTSASGHWVYPSESQFHAALVRKHGNGAAPPEDTMSAVVPIHNAVNERTWSEILGWESLDPTRRGSVPKKDAPDGPKLVSFSGDSQKLTPRARWMGLLGYTKPFDRHDWVVERPSGDRVEYVIDFYSGKAGGPGAKMPLSFYLDVRPKLNSWEGVRMRVYKFWGWL